MRPNRVVRWSNSVCEYVQCTLYAAPALSSLQPTAGKLFYRLHCVIFLLCAAATPQAICYPPFFL